MRSLSSGADEIERGDVVLEVNRKPTPDLGTYRSVVLGRPRDAVTWLYLYRPRTAQSYLAKLKTDGDLEQR